MPVRHLLPSALLLLSAAPLSAQDVPAERDLPKPNATIKEAFKGLPVALEVSGGRLLVRDSVGGELRRADFSNGQAEKLMEAGSEENQFRMVGTLVRWPADTIIIPDAAKGRLMVFGPDGAFARFQPFRGPAPRFALGRSGFITNVPPRPVPPAGPTAAPARLPYPVLRFGPRGIDTVAQLMPPQQPRPPQLASGTGVMTVTMPSVPVQSIDTWVAYRDGTVAIFRAASYRIDYIGPDGTRSQSDSIPFPKIAVTDGDKKLMLADFRKGYEEKMKLSPQRVQISSFNYVDPSVMPTQHPPFRSDVAPVMGPDERVWLMVRCTKDEKSVCYDVIDRSGKRVDRVRLPANTRVVAVGSTVVYTVNEQKDDKYVLQRHALN